MVLGSANEMPAIPGDGTDQRHSGRRNRPAPFRATEPTSAIPGDGTDQRHSGRRNRPTPFRWRVGVARASASHARGGRTRVGVGLSLFALSLTLYIARMAPTVVPGDPGEYQLVAARWGIAHPPGYGFYALLGNLFTRLVPIGSFAWRANLLSAVCASAIVALTYGIGQTLSRRPTPYAVHLPSVVGALALATGIGFWQHAIHANAHIVTALLATSTLYCLVRWMRASTRRTGADRWLLFSAFLAGVSPVQHPLLVFAFPAYILFVLIVVLSRMRLIHQVTQGEYFRQPTGGRLAILFLQVLGCGLLGLTAYLYYPIRSAIGPPPAPGPTDMHTWAGFVRVVTARGLRGNLLQFSLREIVWRLWDTRVLFRLQYAVSGLLLGAVGLLRLWRRSWRPALLLSAYLACVLFVTVNVLQDAMAYLLGPMVVVGVLIGVGTDAIAECLARCQGMRGSLARHSAGVRFATTLLALALPFSSFVINWARMDLSDFCDADLWLRQIESRFVGQGRRAVLLTEWERMTTVYYYAAMGRTWDGDDLRFVPISAGTEAPFLRAADQYLPAGPVYMTTYRPQVARKYRLMPSGALWQVLPAWPRELPARAREAYIVALDPAAGTSAAPSTALEIVGWTLSEARSYAAASRPKPGDILYLDLYMRFPDPGSVSGLGSVTRRSVGRGDLNRPFYLPWARLGDTTYHFTTDSRFNTPWWKPGEIVVERFELPVSWSTPPGRLPLQVGIRSVSEGRNLELRKSATRRTPFLATEPTDGRRRTRVGRGLEGAQDAATLTEIDIAPADWRPPRRKLERALGNLRGQMLLRGARISGRPVAALSGTGVHRLSLRPGTRLAVLLDWESVCPIEENYKVFVQLLDAGLQVRAQGDDKAPLGGSAPTLLWFPRWRRGTRITDIYFLDVPPDLPPGSYPLVVGMYGFSTFRRVQVVSPDGDMEGDWITLAHLQVD